MRLEQLTRERWDEQATCKSIFEPLTAQISFCSQVDLFERMANLRDRTATWPLE